MKYAQLLNAYREHIVSVGYKMDSNPERRYPVFVKGHGLLVEGKFIVMPRQVHFSMPVGKAIHYCARGSARKVMPIEFLDSDDQRGISVFRTPVVKRHKATLSFLHAFPSPQTLSSTIAALAFLDLTTPEEATEGVAEEGDDDEDEEYEDLNALVRSVSCSTVPLALGMKRGIMSA